MTIDKAVELMELYTAPGRREHYTPEFVEAHEIAISALRAQQDVEKNNPLTLEEIRNAHREPLYFCALTSDWPYEGWYVVESKKNDCISIAYVQGEIDKWIVLDCYGERWLAYRRPPK